MNVPAILSRAPTGLVVAVLASWGALAQAAVSPPPDLPTPPMADPVMAWVVQACASLAMAAVVPPAAWLAFRVAVLLGRTTAAGIRAAAAFIRAHVARTPDTRDDAPGRRMADDLDRLADDLDDAAARKERETNDAR